MQIIILDQIEIQNTGGIQNNLIMFLVNTFEILTAYKLSVPQYISVHWVYL